MSLGGGSKSTSNSGYAALSNALKKAFNPLGEAVGQYTNPANAGVIEMFTPMAQTAEETAALDMFRQGFTPTEQSLASDIQMQMNPYTTVCWLCHSLPLCSTGAYATAASHSIHERWI